MEINYNLSENWYFFYVEMVLLTGGCTQDWGNSLVTEQWTLTSLTPTELFTCTHRSWVPLKDEATCTYCLEESRLLMPNVHA